MSLHFLIPLAIIGLLVTPPAAAAMDVLLLHGEASPTRWTDDVAAGVAEEANNPTEIRREYLDGPAGDTEHIHTIARQLKERLPASISTVIATDDTAGAFVSKYREELFPNAAVILTGPDRIDTDRLAMCGDCVALPLEIDLEKTLDLIFAMRPETQLVVGITDGTPPGMTAATALKQAVRGYGKEVETLFPGHEPGDDSGLDLDGLARVLAEIPGRGVVILLRFQEDNAGKSISDEQLFHLFETRIGSPVFILTNTALGSGVVGGVLVTGRETGRRAVRLARRILAGEPAREMLPRPVPAATVLDGTALARFGMTPPADATVVNAPDAAGTADEITEGFATMTTAGLLVFAALLFLFRRYRQSM